MLQMMLPLLSLSLLVSSSSPTTTALTSAKIFFVDVNWKIFLAAARFEPSTFWSNTWWIRPQDHGELPHDWWISTFHISFYRLNPLSLALYLFIVWGPIYHFSKKEQNMIPSLWKQQDARFISLSGFYLHTHYPIYQVWNIVKLFYASLKDQTYLFSFLK